MDYLNANQKLAFFDKKDGMEILLSMREDVITPENRQQIQDVVSNASWIGRVPQDALDKYYAATGIRLSNTMPLRNTTVYITEGDRIFSPINVKLDDGTMVPGFRIDTHRGWIPKEEI